MKTGLVTDILKDLSFTDMLDTCVALGIETVELGCGNWSSAPHVNRLELLHNTAARRQFIAELQARDIQIAALNCSGNQLYPGEKGKQHAQVVEETFQLASLLEVDKIVMMSGCPGGAPEDVTPNWQTHPILPEHFDMLAWQWQERLLPYWQQATKQAQHYGIQKIAIENLGYNLVYNAETFMQLRTMIGPTIGMNLDPSHLFWMGGDPIAAARYLGDAIYHVHAKDVRLEKGIYEAHGLLDVKPMEAFVQRSWNYVALGYGHDESWWKEFFAVLTMVGYKDEIVLEMEDVTMTPYTGVVKSMNVLHAALPRVTETKERLMYD